MTLERDWTKKKSREGRDSAITTQMSDSLFVNCLTLQSLASDSSGYDECNMTFTQPQRVVIDEPDYTLSIKRKRSTEISDVTSTNHRFSSQHFQD